MIVSFARRCTINPFPLSLIPLLPSQKRLGRFRERPEEKGENSWPLPQKKAIEKEQGKKLFYSGELGPADSLDTAKLQRTAWFYLGLSFGARGRENQRQLTPAMLSLRKTPQGVEYYELNRSQPGSLPATNITRATSTMLNMNRTRRHCPSRDLKAVQKKGQELLGPSQPNVRCSVSETMRLSKREVQSHRRQNLVLQLTSCHNYAR